MRLSQLLAEALSVPRSSGVREYMSEGKKKKAVWAGIILDDPKALLSWFRRTVGPLHPKTHAHHMTVIYKPTPEQMAKLKLGERVRLRVVAYAADDKGQAVKVTGYRNADANREPHITIATDGVGPIYSNELLAGGATPVAGPTLVGRVGFFDGKQDRFDFEDTIYEPGD